MNDMNEDEMEKYLTALATHHEALESFMRAWESASEIKDTKSRELELSRLEIIFDIYFQPNFLKVEEFREEVLKARTTPPDLFMIGNQLQN